MTLSEFLQESRNSIMYTSLHKKIKIGDIVVCIYDGRQNRRNFKVEYGKKYKVSSVSNHTLVKLEGMGDSNWHYSRFADPVEFAAKNYNI